jgi:hypothetical protein
MPRLAASGSKPRRFRPLIDGAQCQRYALDAANSVATIPDVFGTAELEAYIARSDAMPRQAGASGFVDRQGVPVPKPRAEVCLTPDGRPYVYSRRAQPTVRYPEWIARGVVPAFLRRVEALYPGHEYTALSNGVDIEYSAAHRQGGSIGRHADDELYAHTRDPLDKWGLVVIFSVGQARHLRVFRKDTNANVANVRMPHNSLTVMYGPTFQELYTHEVPKLLPDEDVLVRRSLNLRFCHRARAAEEEEGRNDGGGDGDGDVLSAAAVAAAAAATPPTPPPLLRS